MKKLIEIIVRYRLWKDTEGQDFVEYALLIGFITVAVAATFPPAAGSVGTIFSRLQSLLQLS